MSASSPMNDERRRQLTQATQTANDLGVTAYVRSYTVSLAQLILRVELSNGELVELYMRGVESASFLSRWRHLSLGVEYDDGGMTTIFDRPGGFSVRCRVAYVNLKDEADEEDVD